MNQISYFSEKYTWLIVVNEMIYRRAFDIIRNLPLRLDTDLTISIVKEISYEHEAKTIATALNTKRNTTVIGNFTPTFENYLNEMNEKIGILVKNDKKPLELPLFEIQQIYKIRSSNNKSCVVNELGVYTANGLKISKFLQVEKRTNFHQENFRISKVAAAPGIQSNTLVRHVYDAILKFLIERLNATLKENIYDSWGWEIGNDSSRIGLYSSIAADISDLGFSTIQITKENIPFMDYTLEVVQI